MHLPRRTEGLVEEPDWIAEYRVEKWPESSPWRPFRYTAAQTNEGKNKIHYMFTTSGAEVGFVLGMAMSFVQMSKEGDAFVAPEHLTDHHLYRVRHKVTGQTIIV